MTSVKSAPVTATGDLSEPSSGAPRASTAVRVLVLARVALVPTITCYAVGVVLAGVIAALASGTTPGGQPGLDQAVAVGVPLWLAAHLVPLRLSGASLGALPLAPAIGVAVLVAIVARGAVRRLAGPAGSGGGLNSVGSIVATAAAAHAVIGVLAAALLAPESVVDASSGQAGVVCGVLAGVAALVGVAGPSGLLAEGRRRTPGWAWRGIVAGAFAASALVTAGALLVLAALAADAAAVAEIFTRIAPQAGSGVGLLLLSASYLPNAAVAGASWTLGPGASIGVASASPTAVVVAPLPPVPLMAAMPSAAPPSWAALTFAVPLAVASVVGWRLAPTTPDRAARLHSLAAVATAAVTAAVLLGVGAALAGGRLGTGPFDPVSVPALLLTGVTLAWVLIPAVAVALLAVPPTRPSPPARPRPHARPCRATGTGHPVDTEEDSAPDPGEEAGVTVATTDDPPGGDADDTPSG